MRRMDQKVLRRAMSIVQSEMTAGAEHKECFYHRCDSKAIKAHSIQNNKILSSLARGGMVMHPAPSIDSGEIVVDVVEVGRG